MEFHILIKLHPDQNRVLRGRIREDGLTKQRGPSVRWPASWDERVCGLMPDAILAQAVELFAFRVARTRRRWQRHRGLDGFFFTVGIGKYAADARALVCERLH
jgi:hypothetical protein